MRWCLNDERPAGGLEAISQFAAGLRIGEPEGVSPRCSAHLLSSCPSRRARSQEDAFRPKLIQPGGFLSGLVRVVFIRVKRERSRRSAFHTDKDHTDKKTRLTEGLR